MPERTRVLVIHGGAVGDCVLCTQFIAAWKTTDDRLNITLAARSPIAQWYANGRVVNVAIDLEDALAAARIEPAPDTRHRNRRNAIERFPADVVVSFLGSAVTDPIVEHMGHSNTRRYVIDPRSRDSSPVDNPHITRHITRQWTDDLRDQGLTIPDVPLDQRLNIDLAERDTPRVMTNPDSPRVIIHPGSGGRSKCPPLQHLESIVDSLVALGVNLSWMVGPTERDRQGATLIDRLAQTAPVIEEHDIHRAADQLRQATAFVGCDAGMTHVAASLGLYTVAIFGPTDDRVWRPIGPHVHCLRFEDIASDKTSVVDLLRGFVAPSPPRR
jgi:ADP-heptose:LPS heptosyltransferase